MLHVSLLGEQSIVKDGTRAAPGSEQNAARQDRGSLFSSGQG